MKDGFKIFMISGLFIVAFMAISLVFAGQAVFRVEAPLQTQTLASGQWTISYEDKFNKQLITYEPSKNIWGLINYALFDEGNDGVLVGTDNWLFSKEEFEFKKDRPENIHKNISFIAAVHNHLMAQNIKLVIVPVPAKARICREFLGRYEFPSYNEGVYDKFVQDMSLMAIDTVDLLTPMQHAESPDMLYLRTDTHWSPAGAQLAAQITGSYIKDNIKGLALDKKSYRTHVKRAENHSGDLVRYLPGAGFFPEVIQTVQTMPIGKKVLKNIESVLFSSEDTPRVALVGTSYSAEPEWNFEGFLKEYLHADILNVAEKGMGPFETMKKYLGDKSFRETAPVLIIWEVPERYLSFSYDLDTNFSTQGTAL